MKTSPETQDLGHKLAKHTVPKAEGLMLPQADVEGSPQKIYCKGFRVGTTSKNRDARMSHAVVF